MAYAAREVHIVSCRRAGFALSAFREGNFHKIVFLKGIYSERKDFARIGSLSYLIRLTTLFDVMLRVHFFSRLVIQ